MKLEDHPDFVGFNARGACLWRRRAGSPKEAKVAPVQTMVAIQSKQPGGGLVNKLSDSLEVDDLQKFRTSWIVSKSNASRSLASIVASLFFEAISD